MKSVAIFLADGFEEVEALTVVDILRRANINVDMISISDKKEVTGRTNISVNADFCGVPTATENYDGVVLPGGMPGTTNLLEHKGVNEFLFKMKEKGKMLAAICAAPTVFGKLGFLAGKEACCYPGMEAELRDAKANTKEVNVDENIITSRGIGTAIEFSLAMIKYLLNEEVARNIAKDIVYENKNH